MKTISSKAVLLLIILLLIKTISFAQPGGGGGLSIKGLYHDNGALIDLKNDDTRIHCFVLSGNQLVEEIYDFSPLNLHPSNWNYYQSREVSYTNQRLVITFKNKTMIVDVLDIMQENGAGYSESMDSLFFQNGYLIIDLNRNNVDPNLRQLLLNGITPSTKETLLHAGKIQFAKQADLSFLSEKNLTAHFILKRGIHLFKTAKTNDAIADLDKAIDMGLNNTDMEEALATLSTCYAKNGATEKAIELITQIIQELHVSDNYRLMNYYHTRIELQTMLNQYQNALNDFDFIIKNTDEHQLIYRAEKAAYKQKYLNDCESAIQDFKTIIHTIPDDHLKDRPGGWSEYAETYFAYGSLEYKCNNFESACHHWLKAMEFGYAQTSSDCAVKYFDTVIFSNPNTPELYLSRALANYKRAPYLGWGDETKKVLSMALNDIDTAESNGLIDFRINLYRAMVLHLLKMNEDALDQINFAIQKNKNDPRCYSVRYQVLSDLGKTVWGKDHPDLVKFRELSKQWKFPKD